MQIAGARCLVTGSSSGIGRELALTLLHLGARVWATARDIRSIEDLTSHNISILELDVRRDAMVRDAINRIGKLDMLVNNAGYGLYGAVEEVSDAELFDQFDTNFFGPWRLCRAVLPGMRSQRSGVIINISSYAGRLPLANGGPYRASKHALEALSGVLHLEVSHFGIRVLNVQLGNVATGFGKSMVNARANSTNGAYAPMQKAVNRIYKKVGARPLSPQKVAQDIVSEAKKERGPYRIVIGDDAKRMIEMSKQEDWVYEKYLVEELGFDWHPLSIAPSNE